jgi:hypothetical protein
MSNKKEKILALFMFLVGVFIFVALRFHPRLRLRLSSLERRRRGQDEIISDIEQAPVASRPLDPDLIPAVIYRAKTQKADWAEDPKILVVKVRRKGRKGSSEDEQVDLLLPAPPPKSKKVLWEEPEGWLPIDNGPPACCICVVNILESDNVRVLPCDHFYHVPCVDDWLITYSDTCPLW